MTPGNSRGATGVKPGTADASAYAPLRRPVFRALHAGDRPPRVTHLVAANPSRTE
jgi:hypothetical protein